MSRRFHLALCLGAAFSSLIAAAAPARAADDTITITGRTPEKQTASSVTVITADDIARTQAPSVFEALRASPGVTATQTGGAGQIATIRLRGAASGQTLTLIDGVPVNDTTSPSGYNYAYLDSGVVERIEVLRGAGSAIWGSDALGGVINIITATPGGNALNAYAEGGSFNTERLGARGAYSSGPLTLSAYGTGFKTSGISAAAAQDGNSEADGADSLSFGGRATVKLGGGFTAGLGARTTQGHADFDDGFSLATGIADSGALAHSRESLGDAHLGWRRVSGGYGVDGSVSQSLTKTQSDGSFGPFATRAERTQYRLTADAAIAANQVVLIGGEHSKLRAETSFAPSDSSATDAGFATYQGKFFGRLLLEGGARYEHDDRYGGVSTGRVGASVDVWEGGSIRATLGNAFRAPSINETSGGGFKLPNPNLKPEKSREWEIGVEQKLFGGAAKIGLVYFDQDTTDLITGAGALSYINLPKADSKGVELTAEGAIGRVDFNASYTHDKAIDETTGLQLQHVAKDQAALNADWRATDAFSIGAGLVWYGATNDTNFGTFEPVVNAAWTRLDLRASYRVNKQVEFYGRIENVGDEQYEEVFGYGEPGRAAYLGVRVKR